jgi:hypothetical protein
MLKQIHATGLPIQEYPPVLSRVGKGESMFYSLPYEARKVEATEARLNAIYDAAKLGLKGDTLALAAGMLPVEYRQLCQLDPIAEIAAQKGRADGEIEASKQLHKAAAEGDAKASLAILQHVHGWVAKQAITIDVDQRISITAALAEAERRVVDVVDVIENNPSERLASRLDAVHEVQR